MTPVAKWFEIKENGDLRSGNGGITNMWGTWSQPGDKNQFLFKNEHGQTDPFGPFFMKNVGDTLVLNRKEDGVMVSVYMIPAQERPRAFWDLILGDWEPDISKGDSNKHVFFRWDRRYAAQDLTSTISSSRGYWHFNGHRPVLTLIPDTDQGKSDRWQVVFKGQDKMVWQKICESNDCEQISFSSVKN